MQIDSTPNIFNNAYLDKSPFVESIGPDKEAPATNPVAQTEGTTKTFGQFLQNAISDVNQAQLHSDDMNTRFAAGEPLDIHQVMIAYQEANVALHLAMQVRNKLVDAYQEVMRVNM